MPPRCITAESAKWNSGRLTSIRATASPRRTPPAASPPAIAWTQAAYSPQVQVNSSPRVRIAGRSGWAAAVAWNASHAVRPSSPAGRSVLLPTVLTSIRLEAYPAAAYGKRFASLSHVETLPGEPADVVRQANREQEHYEQESNRAGALHDPERNRATADLLHQAPEDVPAVQGQEREQVDDRQ